MLYRVGLGGYGLGKFDSDRKANELKESLKTSFLKLEDLPKFKDILQDYWRCFEEYAEVSRKLNEKVRTLARKLEQEIEGLKGVCKICGRVEKKEEERIRKLMHSLFPHTCPLIF